MRVRDLQEFLSTFTASNKAGTMQGNAVSDAVLFVEVNGQLHEIKKMEVQSNNVIGAKEGLRVVLYPAREVPKLIL